MKYFIALIAVGFSFGMNAQTADQYVIGALGGSFANAAIDVNYTAGEAIIQTVTTAQVIVTQGFHQPNEILSGIDELAREGTLALYPNPANELLNVSLDNIPQFSGNVELEIYSINGQRVFRESIQPIDQNGTLQLHIENLMPGHYQLRIITSDGYVGRAKFVKS